MEKRTLEEQTEETVVETEEETVVETEAEAEEVIEISQKELETLRKKAVDFDGLVKKQSKESKPKPVKVDEDVVLRVLNKQNEKKVLEAVVREGDPMYIPELVQDKDFNEIVGYLPRSLDRSSPEKIHKALKTAVRLWKEEKGISDKAEKKPDAAADLAASRGAGSGAAKEGEARTERKFIKKSEPFENWYAKPKSA